MAISRRGLLGIGAGAAAVGVTGVGVGVAEGVLPGKHRIGSLVGLDGDPEPLPTGPAGAVTDGTPFTSPYRTDGSEPWTYSLPAGHEIGGLPVIVVLHGWGDDSRFCFDSLGAQVFQTRLASAGKTPFVVASLDGKNSFWHKHSDGIDWPRLVSEGLLGELGKLGADTSRLGIVGWSMGGYGALRLAIEELRGRVRAVGSMSTAVYHQLADCPHPGAFDDEADFDRNSLTDRMADFKDLPIHLACGVNDLHYDMNTWFADHLPTPPTTMWRKGNHDLNFWRRAIGVQFEFVAAHL